MKSKMLIDAAHPEETRVVVVDGRRVEEFDYESAHKKQLKGNIYLAKVTRVEPSLQAAFVDFGGNRHGFLAFNEIHPDYYQIPIADRQALLEEEAEEESRAQAEEDAEADAASEVRRRRGPRGRRGLATRRAPSELENAENSADTPPAEDEDEADGNPDGEKLALEIQDLTDRVSEEAPAPPPEYAGEDNAPGRRAGNVEEILDSDDDEPEEPDNGDDDNETESRAMVSGDAAAGERGESADSVELVGSEDALEEVPDRSRPRRRRVYKIQEVIKRRQIILVQVVKEERGTKGAALTTYLSLAGRYTVLMPNTARGGGISRKITTASDRKRLREIASELDVPEGMGLIIRTAGAQRTKTEIKRDYDYLLRLWETVRDLTLRSTAPTLVYEEGSLIKRSIRDLYNKDIECVLVAGDAAYREAKDFMRMLMPSHAKNVQLYKEPEPLFIRYQVERHLAAMFSPKVVLRSGGYIVINQTEALVAIDVNSGRATREHNIEDTALKTNLEAAEEISRQLRLRDLAGLIVIDFIDMDERRNARAVERKVKECLRHDRARIQVGRISHFGLLEMSRQRLRVGMLEGSTTPCAICQGTGIVRSTESVALDVLRSIEDSLLSEGAAHVSATISVEAALYILNQKRTHLRDLEQRYGIGVSIEADSGMHGAQFTIGRNEAPATQERAAVVQMDWAHLGDADADEEAPAETAADEVKDASEGRRDVSRKRRRRGRGRGRNEGAAAPASAVAADAEDAAEPVEEDVTAEADDLASSESDEAMTRKPRRRGRRGGRRARSRRQNAAGSERGESGRTDGEANEADDTAQDPSFGDAADVGDAPAEEAANDCKGNGADRGPDAYSSAEPLDRAEDADSADDEDEAAESAELGISTEAAAEGNDAPRRRGWWQRRG